MEIYEYEYHATMLDCRIKDFYDEFEIYISAMRGSKDSEFIKKVCDQLQDRLYDFETFIDQIEHPKQKAEEA